MAAAQSNSFRFMRSTSDVHMTVLRAVMSDFSYVKHAHDELALGVTLHGIQEFSCNGQLFRSASGDIICFNPGEVHNGNPGDCDPLKYVMLYLEPEDLRDFMGSVATHHISDVWVPETHFHDAFLRFLILEASQLAPSAERFPLEYEHAVFKIAERLAWRQGLVRPELWQRRKDSLFAKVMDYVHEMIGEEISVEDLSSLVHMSKFHFIRLFRTQFGLTPHQFILNQRVNRAREALTKGGRPSDVAQDFGFFDGSHLNRHFKRIYGITPKQYQIQLLK